MAGGNVVEVIARVKADVSQAQQNFKALGDQFKKLKLGEGLTRNLEADFKNLEKSFSNYFEKLDVGATGKASVKELNDITSASQALDKAIARLLADWDKIGERDLRRSLDLSGLKQSQKEVDSLADSLDTKLKTAMTALKEGGKDLNAVGLRDYGKALSEAAKSIKEEDLDAAGQKYNEVYKGLAQRIEEVNQEIKDTQSNAAKQQENLAGARANIKMYEDIRRAVNDAYGSDTRKQIEATMAAIQTSMGKGGVGGLGQKLQDKFGNLPEIQGQLKNFVSMLQQPWKGNNIEEIGKSFTELRDKIREVGGDSLARSFSQLIGPSTQQKLKGQVDEIKANIQSLLPAFQQVSNSLSQGQIKEKFDQMVSAISQGDIGALSNYMSTLGDAIAKVQKQIQAGGTDTSALQKELETLKSVQTAIESAFGANSQQQISEISRKLKEFRESLNDKQKALFDQLATSVQRLGENGQRTGEQIRGANEGLRESVSAAEKSKKELEAVISQFARFTTLAGIMGIFRNSIRAAFDAVKELDEAMNSIAVVTDMTTQDLWNQIDVYTQMANATGSTIAGAYQVAQLYYQQGLSTNDVMTATTETLKLARVAAIDYASATDYMTSAVKGFGLSYQDLSHIMDVYSNLAAKTAADTEEISIAMSKVASIAHSTGMELETTAGFLTQIIATTREAPETAGTSLKTVIARFAEVKKLVSQGVDTGTDEEGAEIDVNKIETALRLAGVALRDSQGQMRDLDDVFIELSSHWAELDTLTQRYIATQAAGSRQQSRFLAMISDYDSLMETLGYGLDAAGANNEQFGKTLDSLESKLNGLSNAWTEFTTGIANQSVIKGAVDILTGLINAVNNLTGALGEGGSAISKALLLYGALKVTGGALGSILSNIGMNVAGLGEDGTTLATIFGGTVNTFKILTGNLELTDHNVLNLSNSMLDLVTATQETKSAGQAISLILQKQVTSIPILGKLIELLANKFISAGASAGVATAMATAGISAIIAAIVLLVKHFATVKKARAEAFEGLTSEAQSVADELQKTAEEIEGIQSIIKDGFTDINDSTGQVETIATWQELRQGVDAYGNNISLTAEKYEGYKNLCQQLIDMGIASSYEEINQKLSEQADLLDEVIAKKKEEAQIDAIKATSEWDDEATQGAIDKIKELQAEKNSLLSGVEMKVSAKTQGNISNLVADFDLIDTKTHAFQKITQENIQTYKEYKNYIIKELQNSEIQDSYRKQLTEVLQAVTEGFSDYDIIPSKVASIDKQIEQASDSLRTPLLNFAKQFDEYWEDDLGSGFDSNWLIDLINNSSMFAIDDTTLPEEIDKMKSQIYQLLTFDWNEATGGDESKFNLAMGMLGSISPDDFSTMEEYYERFFQYLISLWVNMPEELKAIFGGDLGNLAENYGFSDVSYTNPMHYSYTSGIMTTKNSSILNNAQGAYDATGLNQENQDINYFVSQLSTEAYDAIKNGQIDLTEIFKTDGFPTKIDEAIDYVDKLGAEAKKQSKVVNNFSDTLDASFEDMADASRDVWDEVEDIDFSGILDDGVLSDAEKFTDEFYNLKNAMEDFRDTYGGVLDEFGDTTGLDMSSQALAEMYLQAQAAGIGIDQLVYEKMLSNNTPIITSAGALSADAMGAMSAASCYAEAANAKAAYLAGHEYNGMSGAQLLNYSNQMATMGALKGMGGGFSGGGSGGGGGGGSQKENNATFGQDPFYNYIKTVDQYTHSLEALERELDILSDKDAVRDNLSAQEEEYKRVIGANQSYLNEVNRQLGYMQEEGMKKWGAYLSFAEDGSLRLNEAYFNLTGDTVEQLDDWIDAYDDLLGRQTDLNEELDDYKKELKDLWEGWRDDYIDILEQLTDILQKEDEKALEEKEKFYDKLEQQSQDYLDAVRKNIEAERDARDKANSYEDLSKKQKRLSLLQRDTSGRYSSEIQSLQEEIANAQQELADQQVDDMLQQLEDQMDADERRHSETLDMMQKQIDEYVETRAYIKEAEEIIAQGDEAILAKLMEGENYLQASDAERQKMLDEWGPQIGSLNKYVEYLGEGIITATQYIAKMMTDGLTQATAAVVQAVGSISPTVVVNIGGGGGGGGYGGYSGGRNTSSRPSQSTGCGYTCKSGCADSCSGTCSGTCTGSCSGGCLRGCNVSCKGSCKGRNGHPANRYASGGMVDYTGPAWVDGTKSRPEAFLNANQTSLIGSFAKSLERLSGTTSGTAFQGIGDCTIDITIGSIGKDYDIDQAIAKVKDEIVRSTEYRNVNILKRGR